MSKERELLNRARYNLDREYCADLIDEIDELLAHPEEEGVYQKILRIEDGIEVEILPSELWLDGYETGRKDPQKREPLSEKEIREGNQSMLNVTREAFKQGVIFAEVMHGIGEDDEHC